MKFLTAIDRYIARLIFVPLVGTLCVAAMLLLLDKMLKLFDFVAAEGGPVDVVWRMLANMIPEYMTLGIPIGLMMGILLAFRKLALSSELDILRAVGLGYTRLLRVPMLYAVLLAIVNFGLVAYIQPSSRYLYEELRFELRSGAFGAKVKVGEFNNLGKNLTIRVEESRKKGTDLSGLFVYGKTNDGQSISVTAEKGQFLRTDDPDTIILRLTRGTLVHNDVKFQTPRVLTFISYDVPIPLPKVESFRQRGDEFREYSIPALNALISSGKLTKEKKLLARANFHYRLVEVVLMLLLPFLAIALAVPPKRSTSAIGVFLSIIMVVTYHKINEYAQAFGGSGKVDPIIAIWVPCLLFAALVIWMYHVLAHVPGGQPIGALERVADKAGKAFRKFFRIGQKRSKQLAEAVA